ncbi:hypothetical protein THAOC_26523 [Thalassiosira oceanica]|uniref:CobW C-terminal domain-containing protein n=1 Tax=Thalassiosira oceanica TaxID=159749 RepID=K0S4V9_THAOC|nr:hypothetical protein THAOC_26523 [Thalassiosira oceanica]|eukprot:EJK53942.1 hypothetical protein THAOC_26523 [Thalassiosira oceanica]
MKRKMPTKIPVTILTGFLGSGMKFAVIENEFGESLTTSGSDVIQILMTHFAYHSSGEIGVDEKIIPESVDEEVIEVMNGCICCTVRGDLVEALKRLYKRVDKFDGVIIETTGLADPAPVVQTFFVDESEFERFAFNILKVLIFVKTTAAVSEQYSLDCVITVVDAKVILDRLADVKPEGVENEAVEQVAFADRVLLNKTDLVNEETLVKIEGKVKSLNPAATIIRCSYSKVSPKDLLNIQAFDLKRVLEFEPDFLEDDGDHQHDSTVSSVSCKIKGNVNQMMLSRWIGRLIQEDGANLYRYKGILAIKGVDEKFIFQGVGMIFNGNISEMKWGVPESERENVFVFIGKNLDHEWLKSCFKACLVTNELRFNVGDKVQANVGEFQDGTVIKTWDDGNAYRIELDDEDKTNVYAPIDVDTYVRARSS